MITFEGVITEESAHLLGPETRSFIKQNGSTEVVVFIDSMGGSEKASYRIAKVLTSLPVPVTTIVSGTCASSATIIFLAGSTRIALPDALFCFHPPITRFIRNVTYLRGDRYNKKDASDWVAQHRTCWLQAKRANSKVIEYYSAKTGLSPEQVRALLVRDDGALVILDSEFAIDLGIATYIDKPEDFYQKYVSTSVQP